MNEKILTILILVLTIINGIIGFFLKDFVTTVKTHTTIWQSIKEEMARNNGGCTEKHKGIDARLNKHGEEIEELFHKSNKHETEIAVLKEKK